MPLVVCLIVFLVLILEALAVAFVTIRWQNQHRRTHTRLARIGHILIWVGLVIFEISTLYIVAVGIISYLAYLACWGPYNMDVHAICHWMYAGFYRMVKAVLFANCIGLIILSVPVGDAVGSFMPWRNKRPSDRNG